MLADPANSADQADQARRAIDLAADVAAPRIRVFGGKLPQGLARDRAVDLLAQTLRGLADHASWRGVTICMETHDDWCDPSHVAAVMRKVNHPAVAVNWDIMHPVRFAGWTMERAFEALRPWVRHVHFHDGSKDPADRRMRPVGRGDIDHRAAVRLLMAMPYLGYLSGEWINWQPPEEHLPRELATMKSYEAQSE
jgi:sugar phosphate isomerase/epimerase